MAEVEECELCAGDGWIYVIIETWDGKPLDPERKIDARCPDCKGTGHLTSFTPEELLQWKYAFSCKRCDHLQFWQGHPDHEEEMMKRMRSSSFFHCPTCDQPTYIDRKARRMMESDDT